jgi:hypothetical protein
MRINGAIERSSGLMVSAKPGVASGVAILRATAKHLGAPVVVIRQNFVKTEGFPRSWHVCLP